MTRQDSILETGKWEKEEWKISPARATKWWLELLRPALFTRSKQRKQIQRTAYLDGLRGFAAFLVYWQHHQLWPRQTFMADLIFENAWGYEGRYYFACLPGIRLLFTGGHFAVAVFFVISGYVLSAKPLALIYAGDLTKLGDNLASALFRRWLRLHLPVLAVTFLYMSTWHVFGVWVVSPTAQRTFRDEIWNFYVEFKNFTFVFRSGGNPWFTYNFPTWSIPVEFRGSIIIYTALLAFSRATRNARLLCELGLMYYFMYIVDGWFGCLFIAGMLLCELDLLARNNNLPTIITRFSRWKTPIFYTMFFVGIFLGGVPSHVSDIEPLYTSPGWVWLSYFKPQAVYDYKWFYLFFAAIFLISSIPHIGWLKAFFECRFNQYLGRISFSLYLVHGPVLWIVADKLYAAAGWWRPQHEEHIPGWVNIFPLSKTGPMGLELSFMGPQLIILPVTLWVAEIATKLFDEPSVKFSQWAYRMTLSSAPQEPEIVLRDLPRENREGSEFAAPP